MMTFWTHRSMRKTSSVTDWNQEDLRAIFLEVPGQLPAKQQIPTQQMAFTPEMLEETYPQADWTHIYTNGSADPVRNGGSGMFV